MSNDFFFQTLFSHLSVTTLVQDQDVYTVYSAAAYVGYRPTIATLEPSTHRFAYGDGKWASLPYAVQVSQRWHSVLQ